MVAQNLLLQVKDGAHEVQSPLPSEPQLQPGTGLAVPRPADQDFGEIFLDKLCSLIRGYQDTLENLLKCDALKDNRPEERRQVMFQNIYSEDLEQQKAATTLFSELLEMRELLLEEARQLGV